MLRVGIIQKIAPSTYRLYGKQFTAKEAEQNFIKSVKVILPNDQLRVSESQDVQNMLNSHMEWQDANNSIRNCLDRKMKCPRSI